MTRRQLTLILLTVVGPSFVLVALMARSASASWTSTHCRTNYASDRVFQRKTAQAYASIADNEGYEWGGGCWNDDNVDDTPGAPDSGGEGPDCSGLVFKTWELSWTGSGGTWWDRLENVHGPYVADDFRSPVSSDPFFHVVKKNLVYMDAFASETHVAMLSSKVDTSRNYDWVWEAYSDVSGTDLNYRDYRSDRRYWGARRKGWTPDCYPNCQSAGTASTVVVP